MFFNHFCPKEEQDLLNVSMIPGSRSLPCVMSTCSSSRIQEVCAREVEDAFCVDDPAETILFNV